ncbi:MAG: cytochrome P450, partial [Rhizobiaceae bacterium]
MAITTEVPLPLLPIDNIAFAADPQSYLEAARQDHPWLGRFSQGYVVYGYDAVSDLLLDSENLKPGLGPVVEFYGLEGTMWGRFMKEMVKTETGATHARLRASVSHAFTPKHANLVRPIMQKVIAGLMDEWAPKGAFNFPEFASFYPVSVMCGVLGVSTEPVPRLRTSMEHHISSLSMDLATKPHFLAAWDVLWEFADTTIKEREATGQFDENSLLDAMIASKQSGKLDEDELRIMLLTIFLAGYDTTKNMLTLTMLLLLDHPE